MNGTQIRNFRKNKGMSLRAFGKQMGVSYEWIRQLEGHEVIPTNQIERICTAFNVDSADPLFFTAPVLSRRQKKLERSREKAKRTMLLRVRARWVRNIRKEAGLTQKELADALGTCQTQISAWENGKIFVSDAAMKRVGEAAMGVNPEYRPPRKGRSRKEWEPFVTVIKAGLIFSRGAMNKLGDSGYVNIYYKGKQLAIMAAEEGEDGAFPLYTKGRNVKLNKTKVRRLIEWMLGYEVGNGSCRIAGVWIPDEGFWLFDVSEAQHAERKRA